MRLPVDGALRGIGDRVGLALEVGREALEVADRHRLLLLAQHADLLALVVLGTDAAADGRQGVLLLDEPRRLDELARP